MRAIVFAGPSLPPDGRPGILGLDWRGPVKQGDVFRATLSCPEVIGIIDGHFEVMPTVWHKEILWAMAQGIHVYGAASIGALRAAELDTFGMTGVGQIYEMYRDGVLQDDDEVAVLHGPAELGYPILAEAMVNIRATLTRAAALGLIDGATLHALIRTGKAIFYKKRSYAHLLEVAAQDGVDPAVLGRLAPFLASQTVEQKRVDALAMMEAIRDHLARRPPPLKPCYRLAHTAAWEAAVRAQLQNSRN